MTAETVEQRHWLTIGQGEVTYTKADAKTVLAGFAFGTRQLAWSPKYPLSAARELTESPRATRQSKWSYRTYDCLPNSPHAFSAADLLAVTALDAAAGGKEYLAMEAILPDLNETLAHVDATQTFWTLPRDHLGTTPPPPETPSWWLWRAWALVMGLDNVGVAITYKALHRKRPWFFPIFDNDTVAKMGHSRAWEKLHCELTEQAVQFSSLERWFAAEAMKRGGVQLTRLRIHDILLWGAIANSGTERRALMRAGREVFGVNS